MKRWLLFGVVFSLVFFSGCARNSLRRGDLKLREYGKITVSDLNVDKFWQANPDKKEDVKWRTEIEGVKTQFPVKVRSYLVTWVGDNKEKELLIQTELVEFMPGSKGKRITGALLGGIVGSALADSGTGRVSFNVKLVDAASSAVLAEFPAQGTVSEGGFSGSMGYAYDQCARYIYTFIYHNRE